MEGRVQRMQRVPLSQECLLTGGQIWPSKTPRFDVFDVAEIAKNLSGLQKVVVDSIEVSHGCHSPRLEPVERSPLGQRMFQAHAFGHVLKFYEELHLAGDGQAELLCAPLSKGGDVGKPGPWSGFLDQGLLEFSTGAAAGKKDGDVAPGVHLHGAKFGDDAV